MMPEQNPRGVWTYPHGRGRLMAVFIANEGDYQGRVLSAYFRDASQLVQWGC